MDKNTTDYAARPAAATKLMWIREPAAPFANSSGEPFAQDWIRTILQINKNLRVCITDFTN
jgi:hypothetical protein